MLVNCEMLIIQACFRQRKMGRYLVNHGRMEYELARKAAKHAVNICMDWRRDTACDMEGVNAFLKYVVSGMFVDTAFANLESHADLSLESSGTSGHLFVGRAS